MLTLLKLSNATPIQLDLPEDKLVSCSVMLYDGNYYAFEGVVPHASGRFIAMFTPIEPPLEVALQEQTPPPPPQPAPRRFFGKDKT